MTIAPTIGAQCGHASATGESGHAPLALQILDEIDQRDASGYQPYWATSASVLRMLGHADKAEAAYTRAIGLTDDPAIRSWLTNQSQSLSRNGARLHR